MDPVNPAAHYYPSMAYHQPPHLPSPDMWRHIQPWSYHHMPPVRNCQLPLPEDSPPSPSGSPKTPKQRKKVFRLERSSSTPASPSPSSSPSPYRHRKIRPKLNISAASESTSPPLTPTANKFTSPQNSSYSPSPPPPPPSNFKETLSELWGFLGAPKGEQIPRESLSGMGFSTSPTCHVSPRHPPKRKNPHPDRWQSPTVSGSPMHATAGSFGACHMATQVATPEDDKDILSSPTHNNYNGSKPASTAQNHNSGGSMWPVSASPSHRTASSSSYSSIAAESVGGVTAGSHVTSLWMTAGASPRVVVPSTSMSYANSQHGTARWMPPDFGHLPEAAASYQSLAGKPFLSRSSLLPDSDSDNGEAATSGAEAAWTAMAVGSPAAFLQPASENVGTSGPPRSLLRQHSQPVGKPRVFTSLALPRSMTCGSLVNVSSSGQLESMGSLSRNTQSFGNASSAIDVGSGCFQTVTDKESFFLKDECDADDVENVCFMEKEDVDEMMSEIGRSEIMPLHGSLPPLAQLMMSAVSPEEDLALRDWAEEPIDFCQLAASLSASEGPAGSCGKKTNGGLPNSFFTENVMTGIGNTVLSNGKGSSVSGLSWVVRGVGNGNEDSQIGNLKTSLEFETPLLMNEEGLGGKRCDASQSDERSNSSGALQINQSVQIQSGSSSTPTQAMPSSSNSLCHLSPSQPFVLPIRPQARSRAAAAICSAHHQRQAELAGLPAGTAAWTERTIKREAR